ncbi:MAG: DUF3237 domain-containing protein [Betaproteobacteria bacterium]|nr:DUF3237 domain-containing protein [Betaproteobacteria bacterium]
MKLAPLFSAEITLAPPRELGASPLGRRRIIEITGGAFTGERLSGKVLPGGADWQLVRADGVAYLDTRYTLETGDGALIYVQNRGYRHGPAEVIERLARGEAVDPASYYFRTSPWFETSAPKYAWLNRTIFLGNGARLADRVRLEVFEVE